MNGKAEGHSYREIIYNGYVSRYVGAGWEVDHVRWAAAARKRLAGWLPRQLDAPILDLGCGHGNLLFLLERAGYTNLTGVDRGAESLALARRHCAHATLIHSDLAGFFTCNTERFALIACLNLLEHLDRNELFVLLAQVYGALQPGGRLIVETPNAESPWFGAVAWGDLTHEWFFTPGSLAEALSRVGFVDCVARPSGPRAWGLKGLLRLVVWTVIHATLALWNLAETGSVGSGIYTRVFVASALKPVEE